MAAKLEAGALRALPATCSSRHHFRSLTRSCYGNRPLVDSQNRASSCLATCQDSSPPRARRPQRAPAPFAIAGPDVLRSASIRSHRSYATSTEPQEEHQDTLPESAKPKPAWASSRPTPKNIAVLGGGLTGLTTAYYLSRFLPEAKIVLYEANERLGGWVHTERVRVRAQDGKEGTVLFEHGPRTVRPQSKARKWDDLILYDMIEALGLKSKLLITPREMVMPRYIYYPDHLVNLAPSLSPGNLIGNILSLGQFVLRLLREPLFSEIIPSAIRFARSNLQASVKNRPWPGKIREDGQPEDMTIADFLIAEGVHPSVVYNIISAIVHGVYGGDVGELSAQNGMFAGFTDPYRPDYKPGVQQVSVDDLNVLYDIAKDNKAVRDLAEESAQWGMLSFEGGFGTFTNAVVRDLEVQPNVTLRRGERVTAISNGEQGLEVSVNGPGESACYDKVISTLFANDLAGLISGGDHGLDTIKAVTMQVVNLWYPTPNLNAPYNGFGYLIPQSAPASNNPEQALGVLFDSDREAVQYRYEDISPSSSPSSSSPETPTTTTGDTLPGTKLTVMMGGHYWNDVPASFIPDNETAVIAARAVVARHLGITEPPSAASAKLCRACIPQPTVSRGPDLLRRCDRRLAELFDGRLAVAGPSFALPGVLPALRSGRDIAAQVAARPPHFGVVAGRSSTTVSGAGSAGSAAPSPPAPPAASAAAAAAAATVPGMVKTPVGEVRPAGWIGDTGLAAAAETSSRRVYFPPRSLPFYRGTTWDDSVCAAIAAAAAEKPKPATQMDEE
ncbi:hypothetical protein VTK73DRAFT_1647 [Phialemonium thermophilum]|uniref:Amine oxidase domain-containing protein n=1 Tax=Phialemonium thermophilum TaxID=223376 RepID=A0ABR3X8L9_9PEZI